jgi:hypothetical protein
MVEKVFSSNKILDILEQFTIALNKTRLDDLSSELYELIDIINIIKNIILENQNISEGKLSEIKQTLDEYTSALLKSINNNSQLIMIIENNYTNPFKKLFENNNSLNDLYKIKYIKYKKKYTALKNS